MYTGDYEDWMPVANGTGASPLREQGWKAEMSQYIYGSPVLAMNSKLRTGAFECTSFKNPTGDANADGGYGWNYCYLGETSATRVKVIKVTQPSSTLMIGELSNEPGTALRAVKLYRPQGVMPTLVGLYAKRHSDGMNISWVDGHVSTMRRAELVAGAGVLIGTDQPMNWYFRLDKDAAM